MPLPRKLFFGLLYLRRPPWDTEIVPPEVTDFIAAHPPGRALDLGCGTGTSGLALARAGWNVTGVDFVPRAIRRARQKARRENLSLDFRVGDVSRLPPFPFRFDLVLDIGCFHILSPTAKTTYLSQLDRLLAPGGEWLLYGFLDNGEGIDGPGLSPQELEKVSEQLVLMERKDGEERNRGASAWFWFRKKNFDQSTKRIKT